jgi:hypothetical protein
MANAKFNFIEAYRTLLPDAAKEIVEARQKAHEQLYPIFSANMARIYELCRLAFQLPQKYESLVESFQKPIKEFEPQFLVEVDKAEAGRIASLLLRDMISRGNQHAAFAVAASSFCGQRSPVDGSVLTLARDTISDGGRERDITLAEKKIVATPAGDLKAPLAAMQATLNGDTVRAVIEATITDVRGASSKVASSANDAYQPLRDEVLRLAEEVDMLWWFIGDWIEILEKPRVALRGDTIAIASGVEIGDMVRRLPGPYGAYGILRRSLAEAGNTKAKLKDVIKAIHHDDVTKMAHDLPQSAMNVFPVHAALRLSTDRGAGALSKALNQVVNDLKDVEVSYYELAIQAFRERVLINFGGLE